MQVAHHYISNKNKTHVSWPVLDGSTTTHFCGFVEGDVDATNNLTTPNVFLILIRGLEGNK